MLELCAIDVVSSEPGRAACQVMRRVSSFIHPIYLSIPRSLPKSSVLWVLYLKFDGIPPYFLNRLDVLMNPCDIWRQKSDFFLRQRTSCMFVAICNKGFLKVNCGSRSRLALFSGKALMSEEIRASKGNMSSALLREREREKWWCTMRTNQTWTQSVRRAGECICSRCAFYIHGFSISWSALMASSFNFNQVSITANSLHMKFVP